MEVYESGLNEFKYTVFCWISYIQQYCNTSITIWQIRFESGLIALFKVCECTGAFTVPRLNVKLPLIWNTGWGVMQAVSCILMCALVAYWNVNGKVFFSTNLTKDIHAALLQNAARVLLHSNASLKNMSMFESLWYMGSFVCLLRHFGRICFLQECCRNASILAFWKKGHRWSHFANTV